MRIDMSEQEIEAAISKLREKLEYRLVEKGRGTFASRHEILGIIQEEIHELEDAVRGDSLREVSEELLDVAVAALFGMACVDSGNVDW